MAVESDSNSGQSSSIDAFLFVCSEPTYNLYAEVAFIIRIQQKCYGICYYIESHFTSDTVLPGRQSLKPNTIM